MDLDNNKARRVVEEDTLSSFPDELIHKIMSFLHLKYAVQTCLLSSRWKLLWRSMPYLDFSAGPFRTLRNFDKFVTHVLSHRNHKAEVSFVQLHYRGAVSQGFVKRIAKYAFSHNVQELIVISWPKNNLPFPPYLFSSQSLKHLTLVSIRNIALKTPLDFPALTTLELLGVTLCNDHSNKSVDLFSKCVNLKSLIIKHFVVEAVEVLDIVTPRLSNLTLSSGSCLKVINLVAPQLENLTIIECAIKYMNAPPGLSSLCYMDYHPMQLSKDGFHNLNKVSMCLSMHSPNKAYKEEDARKIINMLQELHSARYLTLNVDIMECLSSFPDLLLHHPSPFSNLICVTLDSRMIDCIGTCTRKDAYNVKMCAEVRNFLFENSPNATFIMELTKTELERLSPYLSESNLMNHELFRYDEDVRPQKALH